MRKTVLLGLGMLVASSAAASGQPRSPQPIGNPGEWVSPNDYPAAALAAEVEGSVQFKLTIDKEGRVTECTVRVSSGSHDLDARTCEVLTANGRFKPATDDGGQPIEGAWSSAVNWAIPDGSGAPPISHPSWPILIYEDTTNARLCRLLSTAEAEATERKCKLECGPRFDPAIRGRMEAVAKVSDTEYELKACKLPGASRQ